MKLKFLCSQGNSQMDNETAYRMGEKSLPPMHMIEEYCLEYLEN